MSLHDELEALRSTAQEMLGRPVVWTSAGELYIGDTVVERVTNDDRVRYATLLVNEVIHHRLEGKVTVHLGGVLLGDFYGMYSTDPVLLARPIMKVDAQGEVDIPDRSDR